MDYQRPTAEVLLPSGKKVVLITYFSQYETEEIQSALTKGMSLSAEKLKQVGNKEIAPEDLADGQTISLDNMMAANRLARKIAIKKLIDADGTTEYEATDENVNNFFDQPDGEALQQAIDEMSKKK